MSKQIRVVNADTGDNIVGVYVETKNNSGEWVRNQPVIKLDEPAQLLVTRIHHDQRVVIEELNE